MTTRAWSFAVTNNSDATFRAWVTDFRTKLSEVGLVNTPDTGQINLTTVTYPTAINTAAGYEIWRFPDSSVFLKIEYGTGAANTNIGVWVTVGTGSNGAGTLTGVVSARRTATIQHSYSSTPNNPGVLAPSYMCFSAAAGFFGVSAYVGFSRSNAGTITFFVCRTVGVLGTPDSQGITVYWRDGTDGNSGGEPAIVQALNTITNTAQPVVSPGTYCLVPHSISNTTVGGDQQAFLHWTAMPRVYPVMQLVTVSSAEFLLSTTFTATVVGNTPRNYITLDGGTHGNNTEVTSTNTPSFRIAMLWE